MIRTALCPVCDRPTTDPNQLPFCTERCRRIDFFRWWDGKYAIREVIGEGFVSELDSNQHDDAADSENPD